MPRQGLALGGGREGIPARPAWPRASVVHAQTTDDASARRLGRLMLRPCRMGGCLGQVRAQERAWPAPRRPGFSPRPGAPRAGLGRWPPGAESAAAALYILAPTSRAPAVLEFPSPLPSFPLRLCELSLPDPAHSLAGFQVEMGRRL